MEWIRCMFQSSFNRYSRALLRKEPSNIGTHTHTHTHIHSHTHPDNILGLGSLTLLLCRHTLLHTYRHTHARAHTHTHLKHFDEILGLGSFTLLLLPVASSRHRLQFCLCVWRKCDGGGDMTHSYVVLDSFICGYVGNDSFMSVI